MRVPAAPIAVIEAETLDKVLQHFANPAVGDRLPEADAGYRTLAAGETAIVFLTVVLERGARELPIKGSIVNFVR